MLQQPAAAPALPPAANGVVPLPAANGVVPPPAANGVVPPAANNGVVPPPNYPPAPPAAAAGQHFLQPTAARAARGKKGVRRHIDFYTGSNRICRPQKNDARRRVMTCNVEAITGRACLDRVQRSIGTFQDQSGLHFDRFDRILRAKSAPS